MIDKHETLSRFHSSLESEMPAIEASGKNRQTKAKLVNELVANLRKTELTRIENLPIEQRANSALTVQYCSTVASLEYRHRVWPYEYMTFSRRIGELWEAFCKTAWDYPAKDTIQRFDPPNFNTIRSELEEEFTKRLRDHISGESILADIQTLFELVGDINMDEDEIFYNGTIPTVIDFKSGFGSNEKGNTLRLLAVGRAYRMWNPNSQLMLLVRQDQNNNYLRILRRSNIWNVYTGDKAYETIQEITGADIQNIRKDVIDWKEDLSNSFYTYLSESQNSLLSYLRW